MQVGGRSHRSSQNVPMLKCPKWPRGGGGQKIWANVPKFTFFFLKASLTNFVLYRCCHISKTCEHVVKCIQQINYISRLHSIDKCKMELFTRGNKID